MADQGATNSCPPMDMEVEPAGPCETSSEEPECDLLGGDADGRVEVSGNPPISVQEPQMQEMELLLEPEVGATPQQQKPLIGGDESEDLEMKDLVEGPAAGKPTKRRRKSVTLTAAENRGNLEEQAVEILLKRRWKKRGFKPNRSDFCTKRLPKQGFKTAVEVIYEALKSQPASKTYRYKGSAVPAKTYSAIESELFLILSQQEKQKMQMDGARDELGKIFSMENAAAMAGRVSSLSRFLRLHLQAMDPIPFPSPTDKSARSSSFDQSAERRGSVNDLAPSPDNSSDLRLADVWNGGNFNNMNGRLVPLPVGNGSMLNSVSGDGMNDLTEAKSTKEGLGGAVDPSVLGDSSKADFDGNNMSGTGVSDSAAGKKGKKKKEFLLDGSSSPFSPVLVTTTSLSDVPSTSKKPSEEAGGTGCGLLDKLEELSGQCSLGSALDELAEDGLAELAPSMDLSVLKVIEITRICEFLTKAGPESIDVSMWKVLAELVRVCEPVYDYYSSLGSTAANLLLDWWSASHMTSKKFLELYEPVLVVIAPELLRYQQICQAKLYKPSLIVLDDEATRIGCKPLVKRMFAGMLSQVKKSGAELRTRSSVAEAFESYKNSLIDVQTLDERLELASRQFPEAIFHSLVFDASVEHDLLVEDYFASVFLKKFPAEVLGSKKALCGPRWNIQLARRHLTDKLKVYLETVTVHTLHHAAEKFGSPLHLSRDIEILKKASQQAEADQLRLLEQHLQNGLPIVGIWHRGVQKLDLVYDFIRDFLAGKSTREETLRLQAASEMVGQVVETYARKADTKPEHIEPCVEKLESLVGRFKGDPARKKMVKKHLEQLDRMVSLMAHEVYYRYLDVRARIVSE